MTNPLKTGNLIRKSNPPIFHLKMEGVAATAQRALEVRDFATFLPVFKAYSISNPLIRAFFMFFFIAGIQPKTVDLEDHARMCPSCGLYTARLKRMDHFVSVFFLPLFRVKKGRTFLACQSCGSLSGEAGEVFYDSKTTRGNHCPSCGRSLEKTFQFCPYCGERVP